MMKLWVFAALAIVGMAALLEDANAGPFRRCRSHGGGRSACR